MGPAAPHHLEVTSLPAHSSSVAKRGQFRRSKFCLAVMTVSAALAFGGVAGCTSQQQGTRLQRALVVRYVVTATGTNQGIKARTLATLTSASRCRAWITNWGSDGPYEALEVHLLVPDGQASTAEAKLERRVRQVHLAQRPAAAFQTPPGGARRTLRTSC